MTSRAVQTSGSMRALRGLVVGSAMLILTSVAHTSADASLPTAGAFLMLTPLVVALSVAFLQCQRSYLQLITFSVGIQALLHLLMTVGAGHGSHHTTLLPSTGMIATHFGAAIATALVLSHADALLHRWISMVRTLLFEFFNASEPIAAQSAAYFLEPSCAFHSHDLDHAIARRGPPSVICN
ncbi:MAG: hypothetical protein F2806_06370 [Actinobacteria bacterium]|uniref:Unannotated protein n=1 Tax=freshwater metagenome TaxID=449393 RepID=A0A6J7GNB9_9ZZZZ|nr:hypothetical protein [Actinomycetota bacterium]